MYRLFTIIIIAVLTSLQGLAQQRGKATYYSKRATGARTSSGIRLHHDSLTCAHRTYPFGTKLLVKNLSNGKEVIVTVTDRGPYGRGKIIDLTYEAARRIGMLSAGVATVEVTKYNENKGIPYALEDSKLPEFDFGANDLDDGTGQDVPVWQREKKEKGAKGKNTTGSGKKMPGKSSTDINTAEKADASAYKDVANAAEQHEDSHGAVKTALSKSTSKSSSQTKKPVRKSSKKGKRKK